MSSPPSPRDLDGLIDETWGNHALARTDVMALLEPYREHVDRLMDDFDDAEHSWRDYCGAIYGWDRRAREGEGAIPFAVQDAVVELLKQPAPTAAPVTPTRRALNENDVQCLKCGDWHHFDWGHVCPPNAKPVSILHGLTLAQLEASRGYIETVGKITSMARTSAAWTLAAGPVALLDRRPLVQGLATLRTVAEPTNATPYADGVRFAIGICASDITTIEARLQEARR